MQGFFMRVEIFVAIAVRARTLCFKAGALKKNLSRLVNSFLILLFSMPDRARACFIQSCKSN